MNTSIGICQVKVGKNLGFKKSIIVMVNCLGFIPYSYETISYEWFCFYLDKDITGSNKPVESVPVVELYDLMEVLENAKKRMVKLNEEYTAQITKDGIKVGCQTISFEAFENLVKAVKEFKS